MASTHTAIPRRTHTILSPPRLLRSILWHTKPQFTHTPEHAPERITEIRCANFFLQKADCQRVESLNMFLKALARKVGVAFKDVNDNRSPGNYVTLLSLLLKQDEGANYIGTQPI